jgi:competence protein ComEC
MVDETVRPMVVNAVAITSPRWSPAPPPSPLRTIPKGESSELLLWVTSVRDGREFRPASGWATLEIEGNLKTVKAGDRVRVMGQAVRPLPPLNPGEFNFALHERSRRVGCRLFAEFPECVQRLSGGTAWSPRRWLADLRSGGSAVLAQYIAPGRARLASAILLGTREQLDPERNEGYLITGTIHVLSISGLHVGILAAALFGILRTGLVPRRITLLLVMAVTVGYAILVELEPPVVRATILVVMACLAMWIGRTAIGFNTLAAAAIIVLAQNPATLFQAGTQLSFMAVATMIAFQDVLMKRPIVDPLERLIATTRPLVVRVSRGIASFLWRVWLTGALIWLVSTPLVWNQYNLISPVALVLNFAMWIPVTIAMYAGMATLFFGSASSTVGLFCGQVCDGSLGVLEQLIAAGREWPGSYSWLAAPPT